jgi:sRNA-binding protein
VAGLALLTELAPELFNYAEPVPLAIGIDRQIIELGMDAETTSDVLMWWCGSPRYRTAVANGGQRFNLDGSPQTVANT